ncbi:uncharacterized protein FYW23_009440 isoform 2-T2 [Sylvia borin]
MRGSTVRGSPGSLPSAPGGSAGPRPLSAPGEPRRVPSRRQGERAGSPPPAAREVAGRTAGASPGSGSGQLRVWRHGAARVCEGGPGAAPAAGCGLRTASLGFSSRPARPPACPRARLSTTVLLQRSGRLILCSHGIIQGEGDGSSSPTITMRTLKGSR